MSIAACSASDMTLPLAELHFACSINARALKQGEVLLDCTVSNQTNKPLKILPWNTPLEPRLLGAFLTVQSMAGDRLDYQGLMVKRAAPMPQDYVVFAPNETREHQLDLTKSYTFCANSGYTIEFKTERIDPQGNPIRLIMPLVEFATPPSFQTCV
jgi:peptidyl-Lys metalloendopeptidase